MAGVDHTGMEVYQQISADLTMLSTAAVPSQQPSGSQYDPLPAAGCKYVKTRAFQAVRQAIEDEGRILVCGSPGSGKTSMAMILKEVYRKEKYETICLRNINNFNLYDHIHNNGKIFLAIDDIFGRFATNKSDTADCIRVLDDIEHHFRCLRKLQEEGEKHEGTALEKTQENKECKIAFKVFLSSRTDIYRSMESILGRYKHFLLRPMYIINLTTDTDIQLSKDERKNILNEHLVSAEVYMSDKNIALISEQDNNTLGFPYICKMFVDRKTSSINPVDFFQKPLDYLDEEVSVIFHDQDNVDQMAKAAVLLLLLLTGGSFNLAHLTDAEKDTAKQLHKLYDIIRLPIGRESLPNELKKAAKTMAGTYVTFETDVVRFSHPTIYDAVAYAVGKVSESFVLSQCSLQFIIKRVVFKKDIPISGTGNIKKILVIGESYRDMLVERLAIEMQNGHISLCLSHQALLQDEVWKQLVEELKAKGIWENVINARDVHGDGLSFLFWASYTGIWKKGFLDGLAEHQFTVEEYLEAYLSTCISNNFEAFQDLQLHVGNLDQQCVSATLSDIAVGAEKKMLTCNKEDKKEAVVVSKRHDRNIDHLIHIASANGHADIVLLLLDMGTDMNDKGGMGMTPLMYGSYFGHHELVQMLLQKGADTGMKNDDNENCLHLATRGGFKGIVKMLLENGKMHPDCRGRYDRTPLMYAAYDGHKEVVDLLIKHGACLQSKQTKINKDNSLHEACMTGRKEIVELLFNTGRMDIEITGENERTPLLAASRSGNLETVKFLISVKAVTNKVDHNGCNCLHLASMSGDLDTVKWLLNDKKFDLESPNRMNQTPLMLCIIDRHLKVFNYLLEMGANVKAEDKFKQTCMHLASRKGNLDIVKILERNGLDIGKKTKNNRTPIMLSCLSDNEDVFTYLKVKKMDLTTEDNSHTNSLHLACIGNNIKIVRSLLDMKIFDINKGDKQLPSHTPLQNAVRADSPGLIDLLVEYGAEVNRKGFTLMHLAAQYGCEQSVQKLLQLRFPVDIPDNKQKTPLMFACRNGKATVVKQLLAMKPSQINDKDEKGNTLLHYAAAANDANLLHFLVYKGCNIQVQTERGYTPLHSAAFAGAKNCVVFFLEKGVSVDVKDERRKTPLMSAMGQLNDNSEVVRILMESGADVHVVSTLGDSLLHAASEFGAHTNTVQELMNTVTLDINLLNKDGNSPIMVAARHGKENMFKFLLAKEANLAFVNEEGRTILHLTCMSEKINKNIIKELLGKGINPGTQDKKGLTPEAYITDERKRHDVVLLFRGKGTSARRKGGWKQKKKHRSVKQ